MSSGNLIQHSFLKEAAFGELNDTGDFQAISKTSAAFTGTPDTTESSTIRSDRLPSGNIVTGLTVNGSISNELAKTVVHDEFLAATMMKDWPAAATPITTDVAYDATAGTLTTGGTDFTTVVAVGDTITISGLVAPADIYNNTAVFTVTAVTSTVLNVITSSSIVDWDATAGAGAILQVAPCVVIGQTMNSYTFEKQYLDLTDKAILYLGEIFSGFDAKFAYGSPVTIDYSLMGAGKELPSTPVVQPAGARTLLPAPAENFFNPTSDMPFVMIDGQVATYCVESLGVTLDNGVSSKDCIGRLTKAGFDLGTAKVGVTMDAHFSDNNFPMLQRILDQDTVEIAWPVIDNEGNGYMFYVSCQLTGDDPDVSGQDAQAMLNLSGSGAIGDDGLVLRICQITAA